MSTVAIENTLPGRAPAELKQGGIRITSFVVVLVQLGLVALVLRQFQIESGAFLRLALLAFAGFAIHAWLPMQMRLPFFLFLSVAGIGLVLGVVNAAWLITLGLCLIGICHLPVSFKARAMLLLAAGAVLIAMRAEWLPFLWSDAIWPILGSMFMFRLIVYFYDLRHDNTPPTAARTLSYFFMLPNVCFPLFPVVDYKAFRRNYYDQDAYQIYQVGIDWILRGIIHLILYRFIYHYVTLAPSEVLGPGDFVRYVVSNFLLYLRVSGQFHLIVGMLYLFGFRLPETHHRYMLASSFTDFWRRINIYWKDFMLKVFYYPAYFTLRRMGPTKAMIVATLFVFLMTWVLHAYQWFWLRGTFLLVWQDVLFWAILGALVVINSLWEAKHGRERRLAGSSRSWRNMLSLTLATFGTFTFICLLWSFWTSESIAAWLSLWSAVGSAFTADIGVIPGVALAAVLASAAGSVSGAGRGNGKAPPANRSSWRPAAVTSMALLVLFVAGMEPVHRQFGSTLATVVHSLRSPRLSRLDTAALERGYYEQLLHVDRFNSQLWEVYSKKPAKWIDVEDIGLKRFTGGFLGRELIPSVVIKTSFGTISVNRWGMRDKDYSEKPGPGVYRIAMLGASTVMGWGTTDGQTFEAILEDRLNNERHAAAFNKYEILNFAVPGYDPPHQLVMLDRAIQFAPHALFYVAAGREGSRAAWLLANSARAGGNIPFEGLREIVQKTGIVAGMEETPAVKLILPHRAEILSWIYGDLVKRSKMNGIVPVFVFVPQVREGTWQEETPEILEIASRAGFHVVNLAEMYKGQDINAIRIGEWDDHPNVRGHQLIAARLYDALQAKPDFLFGDAKQ
jgi:D-alanyl-lipoteichoic acid acyltransferase DltB (MBOAT superfamily)